MEIQIKTKRKSKLAGYDHSISTALPPVEMPKNLYDAALKIHRAERSMHRKINTYAYTMGVYFCWVKEHHTKHGEFVEWVENYYHRSIRTVQAYMKYAEACREAKMLLNYTSDGNYHTKLEETSYSRALEAPISLINEVPSFLGKDGISKTPKLDAMVAGAVTPATDPLSEATVSVVPPTEWTVQNGIDKVVRTFCTIAEAHMTDAAAIWAGVQDEISAYLKSIEGGPTEMLKKGCDRSQAHSPFRTRLWSKKSNSKVLTLDNLNRTLAAEGRPPVSEAALKDPLASSN